jgi:hypothetical protein
VLPKMNKRQVCVCLQRVYSLCSNNCSRVEKLLHWKSETTRHTQSHLIGCPTKDQVKRSLGYFETLFFAWQPLMFTRVSSLFCWSLEI